MQRWKRWGTVVLAGCWLALNANADEAPIRIGVVGPLSGPSSTDMGLSIVGGAKVFEHEVNAMGGLLGRKVELVIRDDLATPERGVEIARELIDRQKVVATVGYANTGVAIPSSRVFQEAGVPLIVTVSTGAKVTAQYRDVARKFVFRTSASDDIQPQVMLRDLIDRRKFTRIGVLHDQTPYGELGRDGVVAALEARGMTPVAIASFAVGDTSMETQLRHIRAAGAEAIVLYGLAREDAYVVRDAARLKLGLPIVGSWTMSQQKFLELAGEAANGCRAVVTYIDDNRSWTKREFLRSYTTVNRTEGIPSAISAAQTYDALRLLFIAIFTAGSTEPEAIRAQLEDLAWRTESTLITRYQKPYDSDDHEAISENIAVMGEVRDGRIVYAYPEDANQSLITRVKSRE